MTKALLMSIGGGVLSALLYLSVVTGGMGALILAYLAPLPLLMVGLGRWAEVLRDSGNRRRRGGRSLRRRPVRVDLCDGERCPRGRDRPAVAAGEAMAPTAAWNGIRRVFCWSC